MTSTYRSITEILRQNLVQYQIPSESISKMASEIDMVVSPACSRSVFRIYFVGTAGEILDEEIESENEVQVYKEFTLRHPGKKITKIVPIV